LENINTIFSYWSMPDRDNNHFHYYNLMRSSWIVMIFFFQFHVICDFSGNFQW
jgi:hypothetical protein